MVQCGGGHCSEITGVGNRASNSTLDERQMRGMEKWTKMTCVYLSYEDILIMVLF